jgi:hypothetical protein
MEWATQRFELRPDLPLGVGFAGSRAPLEH